MKTRIEWKDGMSFLGESGSGHTVLMDGPPEAGGRNLGPRPMEMVLMGIGLDRKSARNFAAFHQRTF